MKLYKQRFGIRYLFHYRKTHYSRHFISTTTRKIYF
ncbi:unnamed protein product [Tenebrio molitor]|nr:unnamed protein product [Tenebrio molitor]